MSRTAGKSSRPTTALVPWFGTNRTLAKYVGREFEGCNHVSVGFAGSMCEVLHITARSLNINDLHRHLINLACVIADPQLGPQLYRRLRRTPYHPDLLANAQAICREFDAAERGIVDLYSPDEMRMTAEQWTSPNLRWAQAYFMCAWMARHATAGTKNEFNTGMSIRWNANGGDSATHFQSGVSEIPAWRRVFIRRANFTTLDVFDFIEAINDAEGIGAYFDPPFPGPGDAYKHTFSEADQRRLATAVSRFKKTRVVMRFYDHPLVRELYPEGPWTYVLREGRKQTNDVGPEALLINGESYTKGLP